MPGKQRRASHSSHVEHTEFRSQPERQPNRYGRVKRATLEAKRLAGSIAAAAMNSNARVYPKRGQNQLRGNSYRMNRPLATLLNFQGTVIPMTLRSFELWFLREPTPSGLPSASRRRWSSSVGPEGRTDTVRDAANAASKAANAAADKFRAGHSLLFYPQRISLI